MLFYSIMDLQSPDTIDVYLSVGSHEWEETSGCRGAWELFKRNTIQRLLLPRFEAYLGKLAPFLSTLETFSAFDEKLSFCMLLCSITTIHVVIYVSYFQFYF